MCLKISIQIFVLKIGIDSQERNVFALSTTPVMSGDNFWYTLHLITRDLVPAEGGQDGGGGALREEARRRSGEGRK